MRNIVFCLSLLAATVPSLSAAAPQTLEQLLEQVRAEHKQNTALDAEREARFLADKQERRRMLQKARADLAAEEARSERLKKAFDSNERKLTALEARLKDNAASLGELFGVVRQVANDTTGLLTASLVSAQLPGRTAFTNDMAQRKALPSIEELRRLWLTLMEEMTESSRVAQFETAVITEDGAERQQRVTRVGVFNALADGRYLRYLPETGKLVVLGRQPAPRFQKLAMQAEQAQSGYQPLGVDPSRGAILAVLVQQPDLMERIKQGGAIGYIILAVGLIALLLGLERLFHLFRVGRAVNAQLQAATPDLRNPLGRILNVVTEAAAANVETLQLKLDEAILKELPRIERGLSTIAIMAAVAPLLGLLGTVTGMIETFQTITLFGTGDPKYMSGGISQALVTTELGLAVAIPVILFHSFLTSRGNRIVQILDEQSAGLIARQAEGRETV